MARILYFCLVALMAVGLTSCGDDSDEKTSSETISADKLALCLDGASFDADAIGGAFFSGTGTGTIHADTVRVGARNEPVATVSVVRPEDAERLEGDGDDGVARFLGERISSTVYVAGSSGPFTDPSPVGAPSDVDPSPPGAPSDVTEAVAECVE
jgi:hypothetical protein